MKKAKLLHLLHLKKAFLKAYEQCGYLTEAASALGIPRITHYRWLESDPEYAKQFKQLKEDVHAKMVDDMERELYRRAMEGIDEPVFGSSGSDSKGRSLGTGIVGKIRKYSDTLLIFKLKGELPEKYRDRVVTAVLPGTPVVIKVVYEKQPPVSGKAPALSKRVPKPIDLPTGLSSDSET
jgi:hypothetical protein